MQRVQLVAFAPALVLAAASGVLMTWAYPEREWWFCGVLGMTGFIASLVGQGFWRGLLIGVVGGSAFYLALVSWVTLYLGPVPWLALGLFMGFEVGVGAAVIAAYTSTVRTLHGPNAVPIRTALIIASIWSARELASNTIPYGGFAWGRVGQGLVGSPFAESASWIGTTGLSFVAVFIAALMVLTFCERSRRTPRAIVRWRPVALVAGTLVVVVAALPAWGALNIDARSTVRVAAVQGNANAGLFANTRPGKILQNHLDVSNSIIDKKFDVMVWPENASDLNPLVDLRAREAIDDLTSRTNRPLIFGTLTERGKDVFNTSILWQPGQGPVDYYDKRHPVPFGEYMPDRAFFHSLAPSLVDMVVSSFAFGTRQGNFETAGTNFGILICFEVADDSLASGLVEHGAQVILAQTNNSDFGHSIESDQQLAITRMQSIVVGRPIVNISTVATSALVMPDGSLQHVLPKYTPAAFIADVPRVSGLTPAVRFQSAIDAAIIASALAALVSTCYAFACSRAFRRRSRK